MSNSQGKKSLPRAKTEVGEQEAMERQKSIGINLVVESVQAEYIHFGTVMRITKANLNF